MEHDYDCDYIHGGLSKEERDSIMRKFKVGTTRHLILTDDIYNGEECIDFNFLSMMINYDLPENKECYIHRVGRFGRYGRRGVAFNFVTDDEEMKLRELEQFYNVRIDELPMDIDSIY